MSRKRFAHVLKGNKSSCFPSQRIFFDTETDNKTISPDAEEATLKLGWGLYEEIKKGKKEYRYNDECFFTDGVEFTQWVWGKIRPRRSLYLISANIWFDLRVSGFLDEIIRMGFKCKNFFVKGLSQIFIFTNGDKKIVCLNFQNFYRMSVKQVGAIIGREKLNVDFKESTYNEIKKYCKEDTEIIRTAFSEWESFCSTNELGYFGKTLPSQAFNAFRHRFMDRAIFIHNAPSVTTLERNSYFGGRTECFYIGKKDRGNFHYIDINSAYPFVMRDYHYPTKLIFYDQKCKPSKLIGLTQNGCTIAKVNLTTEYPMFPVKFDNKTVYPVGTFTTTLCTEGIRKALKECKINRVYGVSHYESAPIFTEYVKYFWRLRSEYRAQNKRGWEFICKMFLNSLYGKFGQQSDRILWERECDPKLHTREVIYHMVTGERTVLTQFAGLEREAKLSCAESINSFVGIASHVTENVRLLLWDYIVKAGRKNVFYCDTDSLILNDEGLFRLKDDIQSKTLGKFKHDCTSDRLVIRGLKDYIFGDIERTKGIRNDAEHIGNNKFRQVQFAGFMGEMKKGMTPTYHIRYVTKQLQRNYTKGTVTETGEVSPFVFDNPD